MSLATTDGLGWFVVGSDPRREKIAATALRHERIESYLPMILKEARRGEVKPAPMFPGYLFVRMPLAGARWDVVTTTQGVKYLLCINGRVRPIAARVVEEIKAREFDGFVKMSLDEAPACRFKDGQAVAIHKGPLAALPAVFQERIDERRCWVLLELFGSSQRVKVETTNIIAA